jgi:RNA polymerase sigma-54 factor
MVGGPRLEQRPVQRLQLTHQLQLSLELLRLDCLELALFLAREIESNPLLEMESEPAESEAKAAQRDETVDRDLTATVFTNDSPGDQAVGDAPRENAERGSLRLTLNQHVHNQIALLGLSPEESLIANYLADSLTEAGYLAGSVAEAAESLGASPSRVERVLKKLQTLEPAGIFARDVPECLALQLKERGIYTRAAETLLANLALLAEGATPKLKTLCRLGDRPLAELIAAVKTLDPKPGLAYATGEPLPAVVPDVLVTRGRRGRLRIELNTETLPKILVNETFVRELKDHARNRSEGQYFKDCQARAGWLKRALAQRAETLLRVAEALVAAQTSFFDKGVRSLKPLTLKALGETLSLHESTVSRAISNKYIATPRGTFKLRYFFSGALAPAGEGREDAAARGVKERLRELIAAEDKAKPLSDGALVAKLKAEGISLARRTVVKYREALRLPSSYKRRAAPNP